MSELLSPNDLLSELRSAKEDETLRTNIEVKRWLAILEVLLPAALLSAARGNVRMRHAVSTIWPLLPPPKSPNPGS